MQKKIQEYISEKTKFLEDGSYAPVVIYLDDFIEDDYMDVIIVLMGLESQGIVSLIFYDDAYIRKDFTKVDWEDLAKNKFIHHIELNKAKPAYWSFAINNSSFEIREKRTFEMEYIKRDGDVYVTMPDRKILAKRFGGEAIIGIFMPTATKKVTKRSLWMS